MKQMDPGTDAYSFWDRDLSWLSFNERVLLEAAAEDVPLLERLNFLSIFSSNLDEFYRVRIPALAALHRLYNKDKVDDANADKHADVLQQARNRISALQEQYGKILRGLIPKLEQEGIKIYYDQAIPDDILPEVAHYFFTEVLPFLQPVDLSDGESKFFPQNNQLYLAVTGSLEKTEQGLMIVNVPTEHLTRFFRLERDSRQHVIFLDDIIKAHLHIWPRIRVTGAYSFKVTRDAELDLDDDYTGDLAEKIERQILKRDAGLATRFLYEPGLPEWAIRILCKKLHLAEEVVVEGGRYHNLRDLSAIQASGASLRFEKWQPLRYPSLGGGYLMSLIKRQDILIHTPYHAYDAVLRFFNEAAFHPDVEHIYLTMYRVASNSRITNALLAAASNGKKVTVMIELKARFDEENNIRWAKRLKKVGIRVLYTPNHLKVHAKVALVQKKAGKSPEFYGLLATGNLNETSARFYTDHILMTTHQGMLYEVGKLFRAFTQKHSFEEAEPFKHLLVAQFNLQDRFLAMIDREIQHARQGLPARIIVKVNNLDERVLISRLYDASNAGVQIDLIVRSICSLVPGVPGMSENIRIRRIVDRFLEHGRVYIFENGGEKEVYMGSSDWMDRNVYRRIEICFPVYDEGLKNEMLGIIDWQLQDNAKAVTLNSTLENVPVPAGERRIRSQAEIYRMLAKPEAVAAQQNGPAQV